MKFLISIFIVFTIAIQPVLPLLNYAINYDYIVKNLCDNRKDLQSTCKGKCYVEKELAKTEKQSGSQSIKIPGLDVFLSNDILSCFKEKEFNFIKENSDYNPYIVYTSGYFSRIFHPPLG